MTIDEDRRASGASSEPAALSELGAPSPAQPGGAVARPALGSAGGGADAWGLGVPAGAPVPPAGAVSYAPRGAGFAPAAGTTHAVGRPSRVAQFAKWVCALLGALPAFFGIELVAAIIVLVAAIMVLAPLYGIDLSSSNDDMITLLFESDWLLFVMLLIELLALAVAVPWWLHVSGRGIGTARPAPCGQSASTPAATAAQRVLALVLLGVGLQVVCSFAVGSVLPLFPEVMESYEELMETAGLSGGFSPLAFLSAGIAAPLLEETFFRGIVFQFALRAVCVGWTKYLPSWGFSTLRVTKLQFWAANVLQALAFAVMHLNVVQGSYAFVTGLVLGWVFWRTGKLAWSMGLHAVFNCSSFALDAVSGAMGDVASVVALLACAALVVIGVVLYERATRASALPFAVSGGNPRA